MTNALANALNKGKNAAKSNKATGKTQVEEVADLQILPLEISKIHPDPDQPRREWVAGELEELADSIEATGGCQTPIKVRPHPDLMGEFMLIFGEGRWRSHGLKKIPLINAILDLSDFSEDNSLYSNLLVQVTENVSRSPMKKIDEALSYDRLMKLHKPKKLTQVQLSKQVGKPKTYISRVLKLLKAPEAIRELSELNVTQNLNLLAYLTQISDIVTDSELTNLIAEVSKGELGEKALQQHLQELQNPSSGSSAEGDSEQSPESQMHFEDLDAGNAGLDQRSEEHEPSGEGSSDDKPQKDYGFYDYENVYDKAIFDILFKFDKAYEITEEQKEEASEKLEKVTSEFETKGYKLKDLLSLLKKNFVEENAPKAFLNVRTLRGLFNEILAEQEKQKALLEEVQSGSKSTLKMNSIEIIGDELLINIDGVDEPLHLTVEDIKELKEVI